MSIANRTAGLFAALIIGLSPAAMAFSQEARSYTMVMFFILISLYGLIGIALDLTSSSRPMWHTWPAKKAWAWYTIGAAGAVDILGDGIPWVLTSNIIALFLIWRSQNRKNLFLNFIISDFIIVICSAPLYIIMKFTADQNFSNSTLWIPSLNLERIWYSLGSIYFMRVADSVTFTFMKVSTPNVLKWLITLGILAFIVSGIWKLRQKLAPMGTIILAALCLPVLLILVSVWHPILLPRYLLWSSAPFIVLCGIGAGYLADKLSTQGKILAFSFVSVLLLVNLLPYYTAETKPRWDIAAKILANNVKPGDVIILADGGAIPVLKAYLPEESKTTVLQDSAGDFAHGQEAIQQGKRVWTVYGHAGQSSAPKTDKAEFNAKANLLGKPTIAIAAGSRIEIALHDPNSNTESLDCIAQQNNIDMPSGCS
jgi:mannosyltransferase